VACTSETRGSNGANEQRRAAASLREIYPLDISSGNSPAGLARRSLRSRCFQGHEAGKCNAIGACFISRRRESRVHLPSGRGSYAIPQRAPHVASIIPPVWKLRLAVTPRPLLSPSSFLRLALGSVPCKHSQLHAPLPRHADIGRFFRFAAYQRRSAAAARILSRTQSRSARPRVSRCCECLTGTCTWTKVYKFGDCRFLRGPHLSINALVPLGDDAACTSCASAGKRAEQNRGGSSWLPQAKAASAAATLAAENISIGAARVFEVHRS